jgi:lysyl-tRNA synthetase class 2
MPAALDIDLNSSLQTGSTRLAGLLLLAAFLLSFGFIRMSTRLMRSPKVPWWPGSVTTGDVHVHHLVFGIVAMMVAGVLEFALEPPIHWLEVLAIILVI